MKKTTFSLLFIFLLLLNGYCQELKVIAYDPPIPYIENGGDWGTDLLVSSTEPFGKMSGVVRPTDTLFVAIPDTNIVAGSCLAILRSTNNGSNWSVIVTISPATIVAKTRMVRSGLDSIYCMFLFGGGPFEGQAFILKVNQPISSGNLRPFLNGGYRDFDCWASSTGGFYVFADSLSNAYLPRYASSNGGVTWNQRGLVTSSAANPFCVKSGSGDTAILMYYQTTTGLMDTTTAGITIARYREASLGSLTSIAFLTSIIPAGPQKDQFGAAWYSGTAWALYTTGAPGSRDIMCIVSTNDGVSYGSAIPVANSSSVDEYYFDITHYTLGTGGADIIYYYDSTGGPSNSTDKMMYTFSNVTAPSTFNPAEQFSEHYPQPSTRRYIPFLTEYYDGGGDVGAFWVGVDGSNRKVYFDRLLAITGIKKEPVSLPVKYSLRQNYPNPFNPVTKINFSIPKNEYVTLKVYDILGREVATIVDKEMTAGVYTVEIDGTRLSSGVYFYRLTSGNFIDTKKMVLLK